MENVDFNNTENAIKRVDTSLVVELIKPHIRSPKKDQAQIRMQVITTYPEAKAGNSLNDSIFDSKEFGFGDGQNFTENRVGWIDVPKGTSIEEVQATLEKYPKARIYRVMSLEPILTDEQRSAMATGISEDAEGNTIDMAYYEKTQMVKISAESGEVILYKNLPQYRVTAFSINGKADIDLRSKQYQDLNEEFVLTDAPVQEKVEASAEKF